MQIPHAIPVSQETHYGWRALAGDASGGFIAALVALPYGLALARLMGLPPELGLFTSIVTAPVTSLLGRNPVLIGGTASADRSVYRRGRARARHRRCRQGLSGSLDLHDDLQPPPAWPVCRQGPPRRRLGLFLRRGCDDGDSPAPHVVGLAVRRLGGLLRPALAISSRHVEPGTRPLGALDAGLDRHHGSHRDGPAWPRSPAALLGVGLAVAVGYLFGWHQRLLGDVALKLPPLASFTWTPNDVAEILPSALGLAFVASINILITSRVVEHFQGRHRPLRAADADGELGAYGIANLCAGVFGAPMSVGIPARSLANVRCGGTSRLSNLLHALFLLVLVGAGSGVISRIPLAALAGVTAYVGISLLEWSTWRRLHRMRRLDATAFLLTAAAVLTTNAVMAVAIGCSLYASRHLIDKVGPILRLPPVETHEVES